MEAIIPSEDNIIQLCHALWGQHLGQSDYNGHWLIVGRPHGCQYCLLLWKLDRKVQYTAVKGLCVADNITVFVHHLDSHASAIDVGPKVYMVLVDALILTLYPYGVCRQIQSAKYEAPRLLI